MSIIAVHDWAYAMPGRAVVLMGLALDCTLQPPWLDLTCGANVRFHTRRRPKPTSTMQTSSPPELPATAKGMPLAKTWLSENTTHLRCRIEPKPLTSSPCS